MEIELKTGLTACNECKHALSYHDIYKICLEFPIIKFNHYDGKEYIAGYKNCQDINRGWCPNFEQKLSELPKFNCNYCGNKSDFACGQCLSEYNYCYHFSFKKWLMYWLFNKWRERSK
jgi:hypothetical protein